MAVKNRMKKAVIIGTAIAIGSTTLSGCGNEQKPQYDDNGRVVVVKEDNDSGLWAAMTGFLAGTYIGNLIGAGGSSHSSTNKSTTTNTTTKTMDTKSSDDKDKKQQANPARYIPSSNGAKNITNPSNGTPNIGTKNTSSNGLTGIGSTGGRSSAAS